LNAQSPHVRYFWQVLESYTHEQRRRFLQFAWAQDRLPATDADFVKDTHRIRLMIKSAPTARGSSNVDEQLIKSDTCFFNVMLPAYTSLEVMRKRMQICIDVECGMDGDEVSASEVASVEAVPGAVVDVDAAAAAADEDQSGGASDEQREQGDSEEAALDEIYG
jgi:ribosomal protein L12E/L44/L45/RPP1/RPP2